MSSAFPIFINASAADALPAQYARVLLPLRRGAFSAMPDVTVGNGAGEGLPVQSELLTSWPDGSPRALHLTLRAGAGAYKAELGKGTPAANPPDAIALEERDGSITVLTGATGRPVG